MGTWPEFEVERLTGALLRVDLYEQRYLTAGEYPNVVNHLLRSASAACLLDREADAQKLIARAAERTVEWVRAARENRTRPSSFSDLAFTRGWLAAAIETPSHGVEEAARHVLAMTGWQPAGPVHNARMVAAAWLRDWATVEGAARLCDISDAGLGTPLKRTALALAAGDEAGARKAIAAWLQEKMEATMTHEWGAYNEVPIEVSGALALGVRAGLPVVCTSNRVLTRFRT
jgi:hypothetical protein